MMGTKNHPKSKRPSPQSPLYLNLCLIVVTATITWIISSHVNAYFHKTAVSSPPQHDSQDDDDQNVFSAPLPWSKSPPPPLPRVIQYPNGTMDYSTYQGPSRIFTRFPHPFPCFRGEKRLMLTTPAHRGILFQRPMKTGSTTLTGIVLRLVHNRGQSLYGYDKCLHRCMHGSGRSYDYHRRDKRKSFLFSIVREPQARALSQVFHFQVSAGLKEPTDQFLQAALLGFENHMYYFDDLGTRNYTLIKDHISYRLQLAKEMGYPNIQRHREALNKSTPEVRRSFERKWKHYRKFGPSNSIHKLIQDILQEYNLILIMERMDESLVVLQILLNLTTKEILYTRARSGGAFTNGYAARPCFYIVPSFVSPGMKDFFNSPEWQQHIAPDVALVQAAHKSLDRTMDALGRDLVNAKLKELQAGLKRAAKHCEGRIRTMCDAAGEKIYPVNTTCYFWGEGCDHDCIDDLEL